MNVNDLTIIENQYSVPLKTAEIKSLSGGDVNLTYLATTKESQYIIKKIKLDTYEKVYHVEPTQVKQSLIFVEQVCHEFEAYGNIITALKTGDNVFLELDDALVMVFPYVAGTVKENLEVSTEMVGCIAEKLLQLHNTPSNYNRSFSKQKFDYYISAAQRLCQFPHWPKINRVLSNQPFLPKLKKAIDFMTRNHDKFIESLQAINAESVCHNDLKPKNVLWGKEKQFWVIDWEAACDFDHRSDYLDTLLAWSIEMNKGVFSINFDKLNHFQRIYYIAENELQHAMNIVILKWYFWLYFCLDKCLSHVTRMNHYLGHAKAALGYIVLLIDHHDTKFLTRTK